MRSTYEHAVHDLIEAVESWHVESGQLPMPAFAHHLAEYLTARGWVRVHNHHTNDGCAQRAHVAAALRAMHETPNATYDDMASAAFVALLNPTPSKEK